jgi:TetR/AcrR family transcriptional regulator
MSETHLYKGKSSRERLIRAALTLTEKNSFDEVTIEEVVKAAHLSRPAFYYHFAGGKEELRAELIQRGMLKDAPAQDTRQAVIEAALRVFARSGVLAATLEDIAAEAGVSRGALCWHFHSKDDLLTAIVEQRGPSNVLRQVLEQIEQDLQNGISIDDETFFRRLAEGFYDAFTAQSDLTRLCVLLIYTHPEAAHILADRIARGRKRITEYVKKRQEEGYFRKDLDASFFVHVLATSFIMRAVGHGLDGLLPFAHLAREKVIEQLVSLLLYGMVRRDQPVQGPVEV